MGCYYYYIYMYFTNRHLHKLPEILESADLEIRIAAGEAISQLYELAREQDEVCMWFTCSTICSSYEY